MPSWQPVWRDVRFDHAAAGETVEQLRAAARRLLAVQEDRAGLADAARLEWRGRFRVDFDRSHAQQRRWVESLVARLLLQAARIEAAAAAATAEQARREADRRRWHDEAAAERAAEQADRPRPQPH